MAQCMIFEEDEISFESESGLQYGLVVESSEFVSSDEEDEENTYWDRVKRGTLRVAWHPDGEEEIVPEIEVKLADRSLMPGDVVRRLIAGEDSQRGYVRNTAMYCYLQVLGKPKAICDVDTKEVEFLEFWNTEPGDVYLDSWVGKILKVSELVTLKFSDGARVEVEEDDFYTELSSFEDIHEKREKESEFAVDCFYPGQRLKGYLSDLQKVKWLVQTKQHSPHTAKKAGDKEVLVTVDKVDPKTVDVHWLCRGFSKGETQYKDSTHPSSSVGVQDIKRLKWMDCFGTTEGISVNVLSYISRLNELHCFEATSIPDRRLKKLDCFEPTSVQLGDKVFYVLKYTDVLHNIPHKGSKTLAHHIRNRVLRQHAGSAPVDGRNAKNTAQRDEEGSKTGSAEALEGAPGDHMTGNAVVDRLNAKNAGQRDGEGSKSGSAEAWEEAPGDHGTGERTANCGTPNQSDSQNPVQQEEEEDAYISDAESAGSAASAASSTQSGNSVSAAPNKKKKPVHKKGGAIPTKILKKKKLKKSKRLEDIALWEYKPGDRVACEVIYTYSKVEVMWQDGTIESDVPSTELYPIHHLDELEFFPGDYVVPSSNTDTSHLGYGVVSRVDHAGRTCMVTWFKPNPMGFIEKPLQTGTEEEVSVYDIKDHVDYKFRPGRVVVRVATYENQSEDSVAAGQVYELCTDGRLSVQWADGTRSYCYPQEVYLIAEDLSELNSELQSDLDSSDGSTSEEDESWETEEEEEVSETEDGAGRERRKVRGIKRYCTELNPPRDLASPPAVKKLSEAAGKLFTVVIVSLQKLEELFSVPEVVFSQMKCFKEILKLYKSCREVDRKLNTSYFEDAQLRRVISMIKVEMRKEQQKLFSQKIQELIERNMSGGRTTGIKDDQQNTGELATTEVDKNDEENTESRDQTVMPVGDCLRKDESVHNEVKERESRESDHNKLVRTDYVESEGQTSVVKGQETGQQSRESPRLEGETNLRQEDSQLNESCDHGIMDKTGSENPDAEGAAGGVASNSTHVENLSKLLKMLPKVLEEEGIPTGLRPEASRVVSGLISSVSTDFKSHLSQLISKDFNLEALSLGKLAEQMDQSTQTSGQADCGKCTSASRELCQQACHLLREIVIKIQETLGEGHAGKEDSEEKSGEVEEREEGQGQSVTLNITDAGVDVATDKPNSLKLEIVGVESLETKESGTEVTVAEESLADPQTPQTPADVREKLQFNQHGFTVLESAPSSHKFRKLPHQPPNTRTFTSGYRKELKLLQSSLPLGIFVKGFEDRMDLFSVMIHGPEKTPYENGLFFFEVKLPDDFPNSPPNVHYIAYCADRLNPNLYEDGTVCVSLLGTWQGKGTEVWTKDSSLLQILISIQGLILVSEPYYNEAGYEKQKGSQQGHENSRMYNEMALLKMVQSMSKITVQPPEVFETEVLDHVKQTAHKMLQRLQCWLDTTPKVSGSSLPVVSSPATQAATDPATQAATQSATHITPPTHSTEQVSSRSDAQVSRQKQSQIVENLYLNRDAELTSHGLGGECGTLPNAVDRCGASPNSTEKCETSPNPPEKCKPATQLASHGLQNVKSSDELPEFPLFPVSKGFALTLRKNLAQYRRVLDTLGIRE